MKENGSKTSFIQSWLKTGRLYLRLFTHKDTPWYVKALLLGALLYAIFPADIIPDWLLGLGILDDLTVVSLLVGLALKLLDKNAPGRDE